MGLRVAFFEDLRVTDFGALALTRPTFELVCGHFSLRERLVRNWAVDEWGVFLRSYLEETYREQHPEAFINNLDWLCSDSTLLINGRWLPDADSLDQIDFDGIGYCGDTAVCVALKPEEATELCDGSWETTIRQVAASRSAYPTGGIVFRYPWQLVEHNAEQIRRDFALRGYGNLLPDSHPQISCLGDPQEIHVSPSVQVDPFVVIDARRGPVSVEEGALIQPFTRLEGPCHIGRETQLFRANIKGGTTIGPVCRVGGEIEASIIVGFSNKYHDGYLGHSYVGEWCNLAANTLGSDLKLDYSKVKVPLTGTAIETGQKKVGYYIGDFTKTGIGSLFDTGTSIGTMCLIFPSGDYAPRFVPSFSAVTAGNLAPGLPVERWLEIARATVARRNVELTTGQEKLTRFLMQATRREREDALLRSQAGIRSRAGIW